MVEGVFEEELSRSFQAALHLQCAALPQGVAQGRGVLVAVEMTGKHLNKRNSWVSDSMAPLLQSP